VPGPQIPLYLLGRELQEIAPIAFLPAGHALSIAVFSYNGLITFGLLGDYDRMYDLETVADGLQQTLSEWQLDDRVSSVGVKSPSDAPTNGNERPGA
jgi:hypothetical protein